MAIPFKFGSSRKIDAGDLAIMQQQSAERRAALVSAADYDVIWAALRFYAAALDKGEVSEVRDIATCGGIHAPPTADGVHDLADRFADHAGLTLI